MKNKDYAEIYVHIPFCARKCDYCDFVSFVGCKDKFDAYFKSLKNQIEKTGETVGRVPIVSCFFGGGTPSVPDSSYIIGVLKTLKETFDFKEDAEVTIEVNPNSANLDKLKEYRKAGFNRLSIGLQSANDNELKALTRLHTYDEFFKTYKNAREAGFDNINIDLMSAIPNQTLASYRETLNKVIALNPEHISAYSLILEEGTPFYEKYADNPPVSEDEDREMYYLTKDMLAKAGYKRYEISNYSKDCYECKHNLGYWKRVPYFGFGIAAASLYKETRFQMHNDLDKFIEEDYSSDTIILTKKECMEEFMFLGLRLTSGVSIKEFNDEFEVDLKEYYKDEIEKLKNEQLLEEKDGRIFLNDKGLDLANYCMSEFIK